MKRLRKALLLFGLLVVLLITLAFAFLSPITKYLIEKYDVTYTGRQIKLNGLFLNLFTGSGALKGLCIYEKDGKTPFFQADRMEVKISLYQLWKGRYVIDYVRSQSPSIQIIQKGKGFNYDDLVNTVMGPDQVSTDTSNAAPAQYSIKNIDIQNFSVTYINTLPYNRIAIKKGHLRIPELDWKNPLYTINAGFSLEEGGSMDTHTRYNSKSGQYQLAVSLDKFNCTVFFPYLKDYMQASALNGLLSANMNISGNANKPEAVAAAGFIQLQDFSVIDNIKEKLLACQSLEIQIDSINTAQDFYNFKNIKLDHPYLKLAMYEDGYNYERLIKEAASTGSQSGSDSSAVYANLFVMASEYLEEIIKSYVISNYRADQLSITNGSFIFTDYTLEDKFQYQLDSLQILSNRISSENSRISFSLASQLNKRGQLQGTLEVSPDDYKDIDLSLSVSRLMVSDFNPYSKYYVATPFLDGHVSYTNKTSIHHRKLNNQNELVIYQMKAGKKVKNKTAMKLPVRLAVSLLKDLNGDIRLSIPVKGSLDDPDFRWGKLLWQVVKNIMVKAATAPYRLLSGKFGGKEDDYKEIRFAYGQDSLTLQQQQQLDQLAAVLAKDDGLQIELLVVNNQQEEAEWIATNLAKRRFLQFPETERLNSGQLEKIQDLSLKDSAFVTYLNQQVGPQQLQSVQDRCIQFIGRETVLRLQNTQAQARQQSVLDYLTKVRMLPAGKLLFTVPEENASSTAGDPPKFLVNIAAIEPEK